MIWLRGNHRIDSNAFGQKRVQHGDVTLHVPQFRPFRNAGQMAALVHDRARHQHALLRDVDQNVGEAVPLAEKDQLQPHIAQIERVPVGERDRCPWRAVFA